MCERVGEGCDSTRIHLRERSPVFCCELPTDHYHRTIDRHNVESSLSIRTARVEARAEVWRQAKQRGQDSGVRRRGRRGGRGPGLTSKYRLHQSHASPTSGLWPGEKQVTASKQTKQANQAKRSNTGDEPHNRNIPLSTLHSPQCVTDRTCALGSTVHGGVGVCVPPLQQYISSITSQHLIACLLW